MPPTPFGLLAGLAHAHPDRFPLPLRRQSPPPKSWSRPATAGCTSRRKQSWPGHVSVTHFLVAVRKVERRVGERLALAWPADGRLLASRRGGCWPPGPGRLRAAGHGVGGAAGVCGRGEDGGPGQLGDVGAAESRGGRPAPQPRRTRRPRLTGLRRDAVKASPPSSPGEAAEGGPSRRRLRRPLVAGRGL